MIVCTRLRSSFSQPFPAMTTAISIASHIEKSTLFHTLRPRVSNVARTFVQHYNRVRFLLKRRGPLLALPPPFTRARTCLHSGGTSRRSCYRHARPAPATNTQYIPRSPGPFCDFVTPRFFHTRAQKLPSLQRSATCTTTPPSPTTNHHLSHHHEFLSAASASTRSTPSPPSRRSISACSPAIIVDL